MPSRDDTCREQTPMVTAAQEDLAVMLAAADSEATRLAERNAELYGRWRRASVSSSILLRHAEQARARFANWQHALVHRRPNAEVDAAWISFDRAMGTLDSALTQDAAQPDEELVGVAEDLAAALALVLATQPAANDAGSQARPRADGAAQEAAHWALARFEKLRWTRRDRA